MLNHLPTKWTFIRLSCLSKVFQFLSIEIAYLPIYIDCALPCFIWIEHLTLNHWFAWEIIFQVNHKLGLWKWYTALKSSAIVEKKSNFSLNLLLKLYRKLKIKFIEIFASSNMSNMTNVIHKFKLRYGIFGFISSRQKSPYTLFVSR